LSTGLKYNAVLNISDFNSNTVDILTELAKSAASLRPWLSSYIMRGDFYKQLNKGNIKYIGITNRLIRLGELLPGTELHSLYQDCQKLGISHFERFASAQELQVVVDMWQEPLKTKNPFYQPKLTDLSEEQIKTKLTPRYALLLFNKTDHNGAFMYSKITSLLEHGYTVLYAETDKDENIPALAEAAYKKLNPVHSTEKTEFDLVIFAGHGNEDNLQLGGSDIVASGEQYRIDASDPEYFAWLENFVSDKGSLVSLACSSVNVARFLSEKCPNRRVYAPSEPANGASINFSYKNDIFYYVDWGQDIYTNSRSVWDWNTINEKLSGSTGQNDLIQQDTADFWSIPGQKSNRTIDGHSGIYEDSIVKNTAELLINTQTDWRIHAEEAQAISNIEVFRLDDYLPPIAAVDLFSSDGIFRKITDQEKDNPSLVELILPYGTKSTQFSWHGYATKNPHALVSKTQSGEYVLKPRDSRDISFTIKDEFDIFSTANTRVIVRNGIEASIPKGIISGRFQHSNIIYVIDIGLPSDIEETDLVIKDDYWKFNENSGLPFSKNQEGHTVFSGLKKGQSYTLNVTDIYGNSCYINVQIQDMPAVNIQMENGLIEPSKEKDVDYVLWLDKKAQTKFDCERFLPQDGKSSLSYSATLDGEQVNNRYYFTLTEQLQPRPTPYELKIKTDGIPAETTLRLKVYSMQTISGHRGRLFRYNDGNVFEGENRTVAKRLIPALQEKDTGIPDGAKINSIEIGINIESNGHYVLENIQKNYDIGIEHLERLRSDALKRTGNYVLNALEPKDTVYFCVTAIPNPPTEAYQRLVAKIAETLHISEEDVAEKIKATGRDNADRFSGANRPLGIYYIVDAKNVWTFGDTFGKTIEVENPQRGQKIIFEDQEYTIESDGKDGWILFAAEKQPENPDNKAVKILDDLEKLISRPDVSTNGGFDRVFADEPREIYLKITRIEPEFRRMFCELADNLSRNRLTLDNAVKGYNKLVCYYLSAKKLQAGQNIDSVFYPICDRLENNLREFRSVLLELQKTNPDPQKLTFRAYFGNNKGQKLIFLRRKEDLPEIPTGLEYLEWKFSSRR
jgi:hypothetical protein